MGKSKNQKMARKMASIRGETTSNKADQNFKKFVNFMTNKMTTNLGKVCNDTYVVSMIPDSIGTPYGGVVVKKSKKPCGIPWLGDYKCKKGDILYPATDSQPAIIATKDRNGYEQPWDDYDLLEICGIQPKLQPLMLNVMSGILNS